MSLPYDFDFMHLFAMLWIFIMLTAATPLVVSYFFQP